MNKISRLIIAGSIFLVLSLTLLFLTFGKGIRIPYLTDGIHFVLSPIHNLLAKPTQFLSEQKDVLSDLIEAYDENKELKQTVSSLESQIAEKDALVKENESLRQSLGMVEMHADKHFIPGFVSVRTPASWSKQMIIDLGQNDGVSKSMLVVANGGLVGIVTSVEAESAVVKLLSNSDEFTKIPIKVSINSKEIYGILAGYDTDSNSFIINQLNGTDDIPIGSEVVTSDLAGTTPSNIQIGKVISVKSSTDNLNRELYVEPAADFSNLYSILVVGN